ncbi:MAG: lysylphosphatidylglycerol synthase transmembrane domain-containing protein [Pyrinomonadaceae bacterium]
MQAGSHSEAGQVQQKSNKRSTGLRVVGLGATVIGVALFAFLVYSVGLDEITSIIAEFGFPAFLLILAIYFARICMRAVAWQLSVPTPYELGFRDTVPAVLIGEAMSSIVPLGIMISGTAKAVSVRKKIPFVVGLSSVATENIFYTFVTSTFLLFGAITLSQVFVLDEAWKWTVNVLIAGIFVVFAFVLLMVIRQWHFASWICERLYKRGIFRRVLEDGRRNVRLFEELIYSFYRTYPKRFLPICLFESAYHFLGIAEVYFILSRISHAPTLFNAFLLESVSRTITIVFKFVPFMIGVDEAGSHFVANTVALGVGVGVTLAVIRKGRILFWALIGLLIMTRRGLRFAHIFSDAEA